MKAAEPETRYRRVLSPAWLCAGKQFAIIKSFPMASFSEKVAWGYLFLAGARAL
jgi:hypothetical protein